MSDKKFSTPLSPLGLAARRRVVREMKAVGISTEAKADVLERYVVTFSLWSDCVRAIHEEGQIAAGKRNPRMSDLHKLTAALGRLRSELGLGPVAQRLGSRGQSSEPASAEKPKIVYKFGQQHAQ